MPYWAMNSSAPAGIALQQSSGDAGVLDVPRSAKYVISGAMGGCITVALLWEWQSGDCLYRYMRAQHGAGGPEAIGWEAMMKDVPLAGNTLVIAACAQTDKEEHEAKLLRALRHFKYLYAPSFYAYSNILIWRHGFTENLNGPERELSKEATIQKARFQKKHGMLGGPRGVNALNPVLYQKLNWLQD